MPGFTVCLFVCFKAHSWPQTLYVAFTLHFCGAGDQTKSFVAAQKLSASRTTLPGPSNFLLKNILFNNFMCPSECLHACLCTMWE